MAGITPPPSSGGGGDGLDSGEVQALIDASIASKAPTANPTFTGNVVVPDADAATEAMNRQASDARYATAAGLTGAPHQVGASGMWYPNAPDRPSASAMTDGRAYMVPLWVPVAFTLTAMGIYVTTQIAASSIQAAVYDDDDGGLPGTRLLDVNSGATWDSTSTGFKTTTGLSLALTPGMYWIGARAAGGAPSVPMTSDQIHGMPVGASPVTDPNSANTAQFAGAIFSTQGSLPSDVSSWTYGIVAAGPQLLLKR
jgi:hypothetical protein